MTYLKVKKSDGTWADVKQAFVKTSKGWQDVKGIFAKTQNYNWVKLTTTESPIIFNVSPASAPLGTSTVTTVNGSNFTDDMSVRIQTPDGPIVISRSLLTMVDSNTLRFNSPIGYAGKGTICVVDKFGKAGPIFPYGFDADYTLYGLPTSTLPGDTVSFTFSVRSGFRNGNLVITGPSGTSSTSLESGIGTETIEVLIPNTVGQAAEFKYQVMFPDGVKSNFIINRASAYPEPTITARFVRRVGDRFGCGTLSWSAMNANYVVISGSSLGDESQLSTESSLYECGGFGKNVTLTAHGAAGTKSVTVTVGNNS